MKSTSMKINKLAIIAALIGLPFAGVAQDGENLVDNGGFESTTGKAKKLGQIDLATGWKSPTGARADYFLKDTKVPDIGAPTNLYGKEEPVEGECYAGIMAFSYQNKLPRTYVMAKLNTPLKKDVKYCVSFKISLAESSKYACNQIGMNISKKEFGTDQKTAIIDKAQVLETNNKVFNAFFGWETVCGTFTAEGGEKYITIGNFYANEATKTETNKKAKDNKFTPVVGAYYYIDDIVVTILEEGGKCACQTDDVDPNKFSTTVYQKQVQITDKMTPKQRVEAQTTFFAFGKDRLTPQAQAALDIVVTEMKATPTMNITLVSHTDKGEDSLALKKAYYANMDAKRAEAVKAYLVSKGIVATRIKVEVKGHEIENIDEFKDEDDEDLKMAKNRRIEVKVD
jgi:OOP family OmpA-OmpF porin